MKDCQPHIFMWYECDTVSKLIAHRCDQGERFFVKHGISQISLCLLSSACIPDGRALPVFQPDQGMVEIEDSSLPITDAGQVSAVDAGNSLDTGSPDAGMIIDAGEDDCPPGRICVEAYPYRHEFSTIDSAMQFDTYSCAPSIDESGPEVLYQLTIEQAGFLSVAVYDEANVDVDVHILGTLDPQDCLDRGHHHARTDVTPGTYYVVVDSFAQNGSNFAGSYTLDIGLTITSTGPCQMETGVMNRVGDQGQGLSMPATGPMVLEAHLVTQDEPEPYPSTATEELKAHYELSQNETGFVMYRDQQWAPLEGGNFYGAGIGSPTLFPVLHEHWYVNMYWTSSSRPERGTRMILKDPNSQRAVVVAAGYETGPGNLNNIGGTTEETHFYLGTQHQSELTLGIAADQTLPFGPRNCD